MSENKNILPLQEKYIEKEIINAFQKYDLEGKKLIIIIPDNTRTAPIDLFFKLFYKHYYKNVRKIDYLIALGTHPLLNINQKLKRVGITENDYNNKYRNIKIINHRWDIPETFKEIGSLTKKEVSLISEGLMEEDVIISVNRLIFDYDKILIIGPVFPHEIAGFSGSNKYLFPGISGWNFIDTTHWLGALATSLKIIGKKDTPVRRLIDRARGLIDKEIIYYNLVMKKETPVGLFIGNDIQSWEKAVDLSAKANIKYIDKPVKNVLSIPSSKYDDLWTAAKGFYKTEPIVKDGGNIILFAPWIKEFSYTHGKIIERVGFHIKDYFLANFEKFKSEPRTVLAHCTHVKGYGKLENGIEKPRINVFLATGIPRDRCEKVNIGYVGPEEIDIKAIKENPDYMVVENSGEILYRLKNKSSDI